MKFDISNASIGYNDPVDSIQVVGSPQFKKTVRDCLNLIRKTEFESKVARINTIQEAETFEETGMGSDGVFTVALSVLRGGTWGAGQIVHDAEHYYRMQTGQYLGLCRDEEMEAFKPQIAFLLSKGDLLNAAAVASMNGSHVDSRM